MNKKKAFTIVELMVVVGMIAIIIMLVAMNFQKTRAGARDRIRVADMQKIRLALQEYRVKCGEFPARLELTQTSPNCPTGFTLGDVLAEMPTNPNYSETPAYYGSYTNSANNTYNGYFYSGLSTTYGGSCYEYHVGVVLESAITGDPYGGSGNARFLKEDHDCPVINLSQNFDYVCGGSMNDFPGSELDATYQMYDFRSAKNC
jgi:type II secretory pathway pseudopilin PulG